jgi:hypothetical protein
MKKVFAIIAVAAMFVACAPKAQPEAEPIVEETVIEEVVDSSLVADSTVVVETIVAE